MAYFNTLLLAIDLSPASESLADRVHEIVAGEVGALHVVHVLNKGIHDPNLFSQFPGDSYTQRMIDRVTLRLRELLQRAGLAVPTNRIHLLHGEPAFEIKKLAEELAADLVIVGSHSKEGDWLQLPGATTNCVIQGITSDVMAVKV